MKLLHNSEELIIVQLEPGVVLKLEPEVMRLNVKDGEFKGKYKFDYRDLVVLNKAFFEIMGDVYRQIEKLEKENEKLNEGTIWAVNELVKESDKAQKR